MSADEHMVPVTITVMGDPVQDDGYEIEWPSGARTRVPRSVVDGYFGVKTPAPPRVGPLGLTEAEARAWARVPHAISGGSLNMGKNKLVNACREAVAEWDAEDDQ